LAEVRLLYFSRSLDLNEQRRARGETGRGADSNRNTEQRTIIMAKRQVTIADLDAEERRWKTRMKRAFNKLDEIDGKKRRLLAKIGAPPPKTKPMIADIKPQRHVTMIGIAAPAVEPEVQDAVEIVAAVADDGFDIPGFLRRAKGTAADQAEAQRRKAEREDGDRKVADAIKAEAEAKRVAKARGRIATMKAKKAGDTKRMPLTGKAALDMIRNG